VLELAEDTIRLESGVALVDILVRSGSTAAAPFTPDTVRIQQGDVVRFTTLDRHPHAITFEVAGLTPEIATFLERTGQLRSPPLITEGGSWVISFTDAPPGAYPFIDLSQDARGLIIVEQPVEPEPR
jgi:plastocyanin